MDEQVQDFVRQTGRPITLSGAPDRAWITRAQLDTLNAWADVPGRVMALNIRGVSRDVMFAHEAPPVISADMLLYHASPAAGDLYVVTLKFIEV